jgi:DNA helicase-2/ATP-dependent DNA helicase PcrA
MYVAQRVEELRARGVPYSEMAVLYRAHYHAMELQLELANRRIPHRVTSGLRFFEQAHVKDVCAFLRVAANPQDEVSFRRMAMMLDGVGAKSAFKMWREAQPVLKARMKLPENMASAPKKSSDEWAKVAFVLNRLRDRDRQPLPCEMVDVVLEGFYEEYAQATFPNARQRLDDLVALGDFARGHQSADEFLSQLALLTNLEADDATGGGNEDVMRLSTIHQAKGLEWSVVFVIGLCDGMFPLARVINEDKTGDALEEERRLFYVSVTRARDELHLCYPQYRETGGAPGFQNASRFLDELPRDVYRETAVRRMHNYGRW